MSMRYYVVTVQRDKQEVACRSNFVDTFDVGKVLGPDLARSCTGREELSDVSAWVAVAAAWARLINSSLLCRRKSHKTLNT